MISNYDVIVLGLGGMGSAAAYHLSARGKRVLGLERFGPVHQHGSSHGDTRIIRLAYHEHPNYVPLARRAYELWTLLEQDSGTFILRQTGGLLIGPPGSSILAGASRSANEHNLPYEILNAKELATRFPVFHPRPQDQAVYEATAGYLKPEAAIQAHLQLAAQQGAALHFEEPVVAWSAHPSGDGVEVKTGRGTYLASRLVIAPGAWAADQLADLEIPFVVLRHVMCWFRPASGNNGHFPIYIWDVDGKTCFYGFPATANTDEGWKAALHSGGQACTIHNVDRAIGDADVSEVRNYLDRFIPSLNGPLLRAVTCLYTMTPDAHFVVGLHPKHPQVSIAAGFSGHGFKFTAVMGEVLADLAIKGRTAHAIDFLSPSRFH